MSLRLFTDHCVDFFFREAPPSKASQWGSIVFRMTFYKIPLPSRERIGEGELQGIL